MIDLGAILHTCARPHARQHPRNSSPSPFRRVARPGHRLRDRRLPVRMALSVEDIQPDLNRRKPGTSRHVTQRREDDIVEILSGVFEGSTTGTPIALLIRNEDQRSKDYGKIAEAFRRSRRLHLLAKFGIRDYRGADDPRRD